MDMSGVIRLTLGQVRLSVGGAACTLLAGGDSEKTWDARRWRGELPTTGHVGPISTRPKNDVRRRANDDDRSSNGSAKS